MAQLETATSAMATAESATAETTSAATVVARVTASPGTMIMAARRRRGLSQRALAGRLCAATGMATVSRHEVSRWERGTRLPSVYWLEPLAALLGIDRVDFDRAVVRARSDRRRSRADVDDVLSRWHATRAAFAASSPHRPERRVVITGVVDAAAAAGELEAPGSAVRRAGRPDGVFAV
jgi:transcriptional regulator with XRE-family HTH domain